MNATEAAARRAWRRGIAAVCGVVLIVGAGEFVQHLITGGVGR